MKTAIGMALSLLLVGNAALASGKKAKASVKAKAKTTEAMPRPSSQAKLGTSFRFDGSSLHGKFQKTPGTTATVENDKYLEDLLGARKTFADRQAKDKDLY